jgi:gamma-carbonic anhydrase
MLRAYKGIMPIVEPTAYVDPSAQVIGDVVIGAESSIWMNAVVRGDVNVVRIGTRSNIQDGAVVHVMHEPSYPTVVGDEVTVGHGVILHGTTVGHRSLIGMGAILLNGSVIGEDCLVAAGTLVPERFVVPPRSLVMGSPATIRRELTSSELAMVRESADNYVRYRLDYI